MSQRIEVAAAVIERPDGTFLMASRPEGKVYAGWWEFPGGKLEAGETARHALVRELREELGIEVTTAYPWLNRAFDYAHARVMLRFFRVVDWSGEAHPHEGQGQLAWVHAARPEVHPILPANGPILRGLQLPLNYAISAAAELGSVVFLQRLEAALGNGLRLVQLREKTMPAGERQALAERAASLCQERGATLLINGDPPLAAHLLMRGFEVGAHLSAAELMTATDRPDLAWVGASCHNLPELLRAVEVGVDFVVLGPVLPTTSHRGAPALGWERFAGLIADHPLPVFALGGLQPAQLQQARAFGAHGIAMKSAAWI